MNSLRACLVFLLFLLPALAADKDVLVFVDGEKLIGAFVGSSGTTVTFKSDMAGEITVDWSKVAELHSSQKFAVVEKGTKLKFGKNPAGVPQGTISVADQKIQVSTAAPAATVTVPVSNAADVINQAAFQKAVLERPNFFGGWTGSATAGVSLVVATQDSRTYTSAISLTRTVPSESWLNPSNRTILLFNSSYGEVTQPNTPTVKTSILHGEAERDEYFTPSVYAFGNAAFDHDYSQGLDLQQSYGGGIGWTVFKGVNTLDLKAEFDYERQQFQVASADKNLFGSIFSEAYDRKFWKKIAFHEQIGIAPAWTDMRAYSANGNITLSMPVFKRLALTLSMLDTFLNDPPPSFRKNSFELTTGVTYVVP